jgi:hypothetical protein
MDFNVVYLKDYITVKERAATVVLPSTITSMKIGNALLMIAT